MEELGENKFSKCEMKGMQDNVEMHADVVGEGSATKHSTRV